MDGEVSLFLAKLSWDGKARGVTTNGSIYEFQYITIGGKHLYIMRFKSVTGSWTTGTLLIGNEFLAHMDILVKNGLHIVKDRNVRW